MSFLTHGVIIQMSNINIATLKVLSLNCNGLYCVSYDRESRMRSIAQYLCSEKFQIVCLQEVFIARDYQYLSRTVRKCLPFSHWYKNSSLVGSCGLIILSQWPLMNVHFYQFRLQGHPLMFWHGDWFAKKGVAYARIKLKDASITLNVFNMHLHANYGYFQYRLERVCQAYEMARYIETVCGFINDQYNSNNCNKSIILLAGDMNTMHTELGYHIVQTRLSLFDCHIICSPKCHCMEPGPSDIDNLITAKIDYIFVWFFNTNLISTIEVLQENGFDSNRKKLSDHFPLAVRMIFNQNQNGKNIAKWKEVKLN